MATILFIITGASGFILTILTLRYALKQKQLTHHQYALILAAGFGLTWLISFLAPFFVPGITNQIKPSLVLFWIVHSMFVTAVTYGIAKLWFILKSRDES